MRLKDGRTFGPVRIVELLSWAMDCRVAPDQEISADGKTWRQAQEVPDLRMKWTVELQDGSTYGPLNLFAIRDLVEDGVAAGNCRVHDATTGKQGPWTAFLRDEMAWLLAQQVARERASDAMFRQCRAIVEEAAG
jgi:hypothetical protein